MKLQTSIPLILSLYKRIIQFTLVLYFMIHSSEWKQKIASFFRKEKASTHLCVEAYFVFIHSQEAAPVLNEMYAHFLVRNDGFHLRYSLLVISSHPQ
ncbi:hypothetical protein GCM10007140_22440 [Priestia taiwanensis]|uniref:Uncharacterized protein n=1 Tax=Priestia taiwanensis TaxID=1347902 RepID=A0A917ASU6_9BACI|nr:hypothetical protein GCM10007140_22440 [Priestia taiwanensis]